MYERQTIFLGNPGVENYGERNLRQGKVGEVGGSPKIRLAS